MKRRAIALLRVSTEGQAGPDRQGLPAQREACRRIATAHGLEIVDTLELEGVSGAAVLSDERFTHMLQRLRAGEVQAVVVAAFDRLFRRKQFADYAILDAFRESGARLYSGDGELDLSGESGGLLGVLRGELAGMERERIRTRTMAARRRLRRERGIRAENPNVGMPRGVAFDSDTGTWRYVFPEAEAIRDVFRLFLSGERNLAEIHRRTGVGAPTEPSSAIARVLRQPLYAGIYRVDSTWEGRRRRRLPDDEVYEHVVLDPPLIPRAEWDEVQRLLAIRAARPTRVGPDQLGAVYAGHLLCQRCSGTVSAARDSRGYVFYRCARRSRDHDTRQRVHCGMPQVSRRLAEDSLDPQVARMLGDEEVLSRLLHASTRALARQASPSPAQLQRQLDKIAARRTRVLDLYEHGGIELPEVDKRLDQLRGEHASIEAMMDRDDAPDVPREVVADLAQTFGEWAYLGPADRRELLRAFRVEIVVETRGARRKRELHVERIRVGVLPHDRWIWNDVP